MANQYLSLGLFIMLLSFFIVLNSMSSFQKEKTVAVIDSLSNALEPQYSMNDKAVSRKISDAGQAKRSGDALDQVKAAFSATIPDVVAQKNRFGTELRVRMTKQEFRRALAGEDTVQEQRLIDMLSAVMLASEQRPYKVDILFSVPARARHYGDVKDRGALSQGAADIAGYLQAFEEAGLPSSHVTGGLFYDKKADHVILVFKPYQTVKLVAVGREGS